MEIAFPVATILCRIKGVEKRNRDCPLAEIHDKEKSDDKCEKTLEEICELVKVDLIACLNCPHCIVYDYA